MTDKGPPESVQPAIPLTHWNANATVQDEQQQLYPSLPYGQHSRPMADRPTQEDGGKGDSIPADGSISIEYLNLSFEEYFPEHKSTKTYPALYQFLGMVYQYTKLLFYHFFVLIFGLLFAFLWAIINGLMAFIYTWIYNPALKAVLLWVYALTPLFTEPLRAIFKPLIDISARIFRQIRVSTNFSGGVGWYSHTKTVQA